MRKLFWIALLLVTVNPCIADVVIGRTYPIFEENPVDQIRRKAEKVDWEEKFSNRKDSWKTNVRVGNLPRTSAPREYRYIPYAVADADVMDEKGNIIYPKGYEYNPLQYIAMAFSIHVIDQKDVEWIKPKIKLGDMILVHRGDITEISKALKWPVYILDKKTQSRLNIQSVPSSLKKEGTELLIREYVNEV